jgi:diguanylate cyclase (GGDEF)-like protein
MEHPYRASDAVITVCQDNEIQAITVTGINTPAETLSGHAASAVVGQPIARILPTKVNELLKDYIEFEDGASDLAEVLSKIRNFGLLTPDGRDIPCKLKVVRSEAKEKKTWFQLVLQDDVALRKAESVRNILKENFKGHEVLDAATQLPDRHSMLRNLELVQHHAHNKQLWACYALLGIDNYQALVTRHGRADCDRMLIQIATLCRRNLRGDDVVGSLGPDKLGAILLDITPASSRIVLNRLRWLVSSQVMELDAGKSASITISISFATIGSTEAKEVLAQCERSLEVLAGKQQNTLVEAA